jgi:hypothetical protein
VSAADRKRLPFDPIDEAAKQWSTQWGEAPRMRAVTSLMRVHQLVLTELDELLRPLGLTFARYEVLVLLSFSRRGALPLGKIGVGGTGAPPEGWIAYAGADDFADAEPYLPGASSFASPRLTRSARSAGDSWGVAGMITAPSRMALSMISHSGTQLPSTGSNRSPRRSPRLVRKWATATERAASSAKLSDTSPATRAAFPNRSRNRCAIPGWRTCCRSPACTSRSSSA